MNKETYYNNKACTVAGFNNDNSVDGRRSVLN